MLNKRNINIDKSSHFLDYKNLDLFKIIQIIDNHNVYKLNLLDSMTVIHSIFHSWLLHLDSSRLLRDQRRQFSFAIHLSDESIEHSAITIVDSKINKCKNDSKLNLSLSEETRECLQYKIHYQNDSKYNQNFKWQDYFEVDECLDLIADYYHVKLDQADPH